MPEVLFDRAFSRQVGGAPPPPVLGSDSVPANVAGVGALDNGIVLPARTYDYSLGAVVVGIASLVIGASVSVEVYVGDEARNAWLLAGTQTIPVGQIRRFPIPAGSGTTAIPVFVRPLAAGVPAGEYEFLFGADQATRPFPEGAPVTILTTVPADVNVARWFGSVAPTVGQKVNAASIPVVISSEYTGPNDTIAVAGRGTPGAQIGGVLTIQGDPAATPVPVDVTALPVGSELFATHMRLPQDAFGVSAVVEPVPVIQASFVFGCPAHLWTSYNTLTGTTTTVSTGTSVATASTGANAASIAEITSRNRYCYKSGQSLRARFTSLFSLPAVNGFQVVGIGTQDGYAVGYNGTDFGFLHRRGGVAEVRTLTITTASTTAENVTVTLDGVATLVAVTNSGNTVTTAREISVGNYSAAGPGWDAYQQGSTVIFVARRFGSRVGAYTVAGTTIVGAFAQTLAGVAPTDTWISQTTWNGDRLDGSSGANNPSGATLNPQRLSVWQVIIPYLGAGNVVLQWQDPTTGQWTTCHAFKNPNALTTPTSRNPNYKLWVGAQGAANIAASSASMSLFSDGPVVLLGPRVSVPPSFKTNVGNAAEIPIVSVRVNPVYQSEANLGGFLPLVIVVSAQATGNVILRFYLNATLTGNNFGAVNAFSSLAYDTAATAATGGLLIGSIVTSPNGGSTPVDVQTLGYKLETGDVVTVTAQQTNGVNGTVVIAATGVEDLGIG